MTHLIASFLNNQLCLGVLSFSLVMLPIIGIAQIHGPSNESN